MAYLSSIWDDEDDEQGNTHHIAEHGLTPDDVDHVLANPDAEGTSQSSGRPIVWGYVPDGRYIIVAYDEIDEDTVKVVTAYEVDEP